MSFWVHAILCFVKPADWWYWRSSRFKWFNNIKINSGCINMLIKYYKNVFNTTIISIMIRCDMTRPKRDVELQNTLLVYAIDTCRDNSFSDVRGFCTPAGQKNSRVAKYLGIGYLVVFVHSPTDWVRRILYVSTWVWKTFIPLCNRNELIFLRLTAPPPHPQIIRIGT